MKWMITYGLRPEGAWRSYDENVGGLLATFANWEPPEGVEILSFVHRADGKGGWMLVEADDVAGPSQICLQYIAFHDSELHPVMDSPELAQRFGEAMAWRNEVAG
jgi:hypothetical protein